MTRHLHRKHLDRLSVSDNTILVLCLLLNLKIFLNLVHVQVGDQCLITVKELGKFLKSWASSLNIEEVDEEPFDNNPDGVERWQSPDVAGFLEVVPCNWVGLISENESGLDSQVHDHQSLGTELVWQDLKSVGDKETRPGERVEDTEHPYEDDLRISRTLDVLLTTGLESSSGDGPGQEHEEHACGGNQEQWATSNTINKECAEDGDDKTEKGLATIERNLLILSCDTSVCVDQVGIVANNGITRVLREETKRDEKRQTISVSLCA